MDQSINKYVTDEREIRELVYIAIQEENLPWKIFLPLTHLPIAGWQICFLTQGEPFSFIFDLSINFDDTSESIKKRLREYLAAKKEQVVQKYIRYPNYAQHPLQRSGVTSRLTFNQCYNAAR